MMLQYKHRAFKKPLINANILKVSFHFLHPGHRGWNEWARNKWLRPKKMWRGEWCSVLAYQTQNFSQLPLSQDCLRRYSGWVHRLAHDVKSPSCKMQDTIITLRNDVISVTILFSGALAKFAKSDYWLRHVCRSARRNSASTGRIFMKLIFEYFSKICREKSSFITIWQE
jgi:hypothetical protein